MRAFSRGSAHVLAVAACLLPFSLSAQDKPADHAVFLKKYCLACHTGPNPQAGLKIAAYLDLKGFDSQAARWQTLIQRVKNYEMPPKGAPAPSSEQRESFVLWAEAELKRESCAQGLSAGASPIRRLNRHEYSATIRDLLGVQMDAGAEFPADGAGGEGFDNAAETLFLSPIHAEKYLSAANTILTAAFRDQNAKARLVVASPDSRQTPTIAARKVLQAFLPRAFRRPILPADMAPYLALFQQSQQRGRTYDDSIQLALKGALISPDFLFLREPPNYSGQMRLRDDFSLANRLSYFLWGSMPDSLLMDLAAQGKLGDPAILDWQITRMLRHPRAHDFYKRFVEQWLGTRDLSRSARLDAKLFPEFQDEELRSDMAYQPVLFFKELMVKDLSLLNLIDSDFTFVTRKLQKLYATNLPIPDKDTSGMMQRVKLPEGSDRGGLLGMAGVLAISSHPHRTSPVLRGKWLLDAMLGTPPPPPPPDVPELKASGTTPKTLRAMLTQHRENPACASCHSRIDPMGFALENYDVLGRWRKTDAGQAIDATGELPDGSKFEGPQQLKVALMTRKQLVLRNLTSKMLGYALGRGLMLNDRCTVDAIVAQIEPAEYRAPALIRAIVNSVPFRYQSADPVVKPKRENSAR